MKRFVIALLCALPMLSLAGLRSIDNLQPA
jgi:hypothetical protein